MQFFSTLTGPELLQVTEAALPEHRFGDLEQLGAGQHVEEIQRPAGSCTAPNTIELLSSMKYLTTMGQGWPRMLFGRLCGNKHPTHPEPAFSFRFNHLSPSASSANGLSKCYWG